MATTLKCFSVYDSKAEAFLNPLFAQNAAVAIRSFTAAANDPQHDFYIHSDDFTLFELGEFDQETGLFNLLPTPSTLGLATIYKKGI